MPLPFIGLIVGVAITTAVRRLFEHFFSPADRKKPRGRKHCRDESQESPKPSSPHAVLDRIPRLLKKSVHEASDPEKRENEDNCLFMEDNVFSSGDSAPWPMDLSDPSAVTYSSPLEDICVYANGNTSETDEDIFVPAAVDSTPPRVNLFHPVTETENLPLVNICGFTNVDSYQELVMAGGPTAAEDSPAAEKVNMSTKVESKRNEEESEVSGPGLEEIPVSALTDIAQLPDMVNVTSYSPAATDNPPVSKVQLGKREQKTWQEVSNAKMLKLCHQYPPVAKRSASLSATSSHERMPASTNCIEKIINLNGLRNLKVLSLERSNINNLFGLDVLGDTLEELWISFNQIETLQGIECLKNLKILHMSKNMVKEWAEFERLGTLPFLTELVFVGNPLEKKHSADGTWMDQVFQRLPNLLRLDGRFRSVKVNGPRSGELCMLTAVDDGLVLEEANTFTDDQEPEVENLEAPVEASIPPALGKEPRRGVCGVSWIVDNNPAVMSSRGPAALNNTSPLDTALAKWEKKTGQKVGKAKIIKLCHQNPSIVKMSDSLSRLTNCETLSLSKNCIEEITGLGGLRKLKILSLERNKIKELSGLEVVGNTLEELWISFNWIERLEGIECLKHLKILHMSKNTVKEWAEFERLAELQRLTELVFVGNPLEKRHSADGTWMGRVFKRLPNLVRLDGRFRTFSPFNVTKSKNTCVLAAGDNGQKHDKSRIYPPGNCPPVRKKVSYARAVQKIQEHKEGRVPKDVSKMTVSGELKIPQAITNVPSSEDKDLTPEEFIVVQPVNQTPIHDKKSITKDLDEALIDRNVATSDSISCANNEDRVIIDNRSEEKDEAVNSIAEPKDSRVPSSVTATVDNTVVQEDANVSVAPAYYEADSPVRPPHLFTTADECLSSEEFTVCHIENQTPSEAQGFTEVLDNDVSPVAPCISVLYHDAVHGDVNNSCLRDTSIVLSPLNHTTRDSCVSAVADIVEENRAEDVSSSLLESGPPEDLTRYLGLEEDLMSAELSEKLTVVDFTVSQGVTITPAPVDFSGTAITNSDPEYEEKNFVIEDVSTADKAKDDFSPSESSLSECNISAYQMSTVPSVDHQRPATPDVSFYTVTVDTLAHTSGPVALSAALSTVTHIKSPAGDAADLEDSPEILCVLSSVDKAKHSALTTFALAEAPTEDCSSAAVVPTPVDMLDISFEDITLTPKTDGNGSEVDDACLSAETWELAQIDSERAAIVSAAEDGPSTLMDAIGLGDLAYSSTSEKATMPADPNNTPLEGEPWELSFMDVASKSEGSQVCAAAAADVPIMEKVIDLTDLEDSPTSMDTWDLGLTDAVHAPEEVIDFTSVDSDLTTIKDNGQAHTEANVSAASKDAKTSEPSQVPHRGIGTRGRRRKRPTPKTVS